MMKRLFDISVAGLFLLLLSPLFLWIALAVRQRLGTPVLFRQQRPGKDARPFEILKFRTMTDKRDADGQLLPDSERLTRFGVWLRSTSLDELPELWNVLKGDMSLVGPRPLLMDYLPLYSPRQARRHSVRPGLTGLAQVSGRNAVAWDARLEIDVWYVENRSFFLDLNILGRTLLAVLTRDGISDNGHATKQRFTGSSKNEGSE